MAMFTIIKYALAFFFAYLIFITLGPVVYQTRYANSSWDALPVWMQAHGDTLYGIWILFLVIIAAVIIFAGINEARRNRNLEA
jgi:hypothetical protein